MLKCLQKDPAQAVRIGRGAGRGPAAVPGRASRSWRGGVSSSRAAAPLGPPEQGRRRPPHECGRDAWPSVSSSARHSGSGPSATRRGRRRLREQMRRDSYTSDMLAVQQAWEAGQRPSGWATCFAATSPSRARRTGAASNGKSSGATYQRAQPIRTLPVSDNVWHLAATPKGQTVAALVYVHAAQTHRRAQRGDPLGCRERLEAPYLQGIRRRPSGMPSPSHLTGVSSPRGVSSRRRASKPQLISIWDAATGTLLREGPGGHGARVIMGALAFSPNGKKLLWGDKDTTINLWDLETGEVRTFQGHKAYHTGVAFDPRGRWIASASSDGTVKLWDLESRYDVHTFPKLNSPTDVAFSPDGRYLAACTGSGVRMWDLTRPKDPREIELKGQRNAQALKNKLSFSPDGRYLAAGSSNTVRLWEVESGEVRATLRGHSNQVICAAFLDGGRMLASGSEDRTVKLWDIAQALG